METFVINLERRPDRLNNFLQNFPGTSNEKQIKIFKGVDGQVLHTSPSHNRESIELYEKLKKKLEARKKSFRINKGEVGCLLSHALLWQKIKNENIMQAAIFEDDALFSELYAQKYPEILKEFETIKDGLVLYTGGRKEPRPSKNTTKVSNNIVRHNKMNSSNKQDLDRWLHAYVITNKGAEVMLKMLEEEYDGTLGIDHAVVYKLDSLRNALSADPLLCFSIPQGDSDIRNWGPRFCKFSL